MVEHDERFAEVVETLFIQLLDHTAGLRTPIAYQELTRKCKSAFERAESQLVGHPEWRKAKYAVVAWVDAEIRRIDDEWKNRALEREYWRSYIAYDHFFKVSHEAVVSKEESACESFYLAFMFGYRGVYEVENSPKLETSWPRTQREWQKNMAGLIRHARRKKFDNANWGETFECTVAPEVEELTGPSLLRAGLCFLATTILVALPVIAYLANQGIAP